MAQNWGDWGFFAPVDSLKIYYYQFVTSFVRHWHGS
jgi:hypothetical protein